MDIANNHFALFGLSESMALDIGALEQAYHRVQGEVHPDRFASAGASAQRIAMQWATRVNEGYRTLKDPLSRARYLCELHGVDLQVESNTRMPPAFLMNQLEWREALDDARGSEDSAALEALYQKLLAEFDSETTGIAELIDAKHDYASAGQSVRRLMFIEKTRSDVERAIDGLQV